MANMTQKEAINAAINLAKPEIESIIRRQFPDADGPDIDCLVLEAIQPTINEMDTKRRKKDKATGVVTLVDSPLLNAAPRSVAACIIAARLKGFNVNAPDKMCCSAVYGGIASVVYSWEAGFLLMMKTRLYLDVYAHLVFENDVFEMELGTCEKVTHKPAKGMRGKVVGAYAIARAINGCDRVSYYGEEKLAQMRASSPSRWEGADHDAMALKGPCKNLYARTKHNSPKTHDLVMEHDEGDEDNLGPDEGAPTVLFPPPTFEGAPLPVHASVPAPPPVPAPVPAPPPKAVGIEEYVLLMQDVSYLLLVGSPERIAADLAISDAPKGIKADWRKAFTAALSAIHKEQRQAVMGAHTEVVKWLNTR